MIGRNARLLCCLGSVFAVLLLFFSISRSMPTPATQATLLYASSNVLVVTDTLATTTKPPTSTSKPSTSTSKPPEKVKKNLLFVYFDDMRPDLKAAYARNDALTPNLDRLAMQPTTVVFSRAFANYPMCSPSRTSTLFGRTPLDTQVMTNMDKLRKDINPSLFKHLQQSGYYTATGGKIFHSKSGASAGNLGDDCWNKTFAPNLDQKQSWCSDDPLAVRLRYPGTSKIVSPLICITKNDLSRIHDFQVVEGALHTMQKIKTQELFPFAMAVGFYKPHFPLHVHERFFVPAKESDAEYVRGPFPRESFPYSNLSYAEDGPEIFGMQSSKFADQGDFSMFSSTTAMFRRMIRKSYAAGISQSDYAFGLVYDALQKHDLLQNTLVVALGDHGYGLGEKNLWAKDSLYDVTLRVPLIIHAPWLQHSSTTKVKRMHGFVELVDLYRTISSLLDPKMLVEARVDGVDHSKNVIQYVETGSEAQDKTEAFSVVGRCGMYQTCTKGLTALSAIGFTVRTDKYRYTVWMRGQRGLQWNRDNIITEELYSHANDAVTLFNYGDAGTSYDVELENIAIQNANVCTDMYIKIKTRFE